MSEVRRYLTVLQDREGYPPSTPLPTKEDAGEPPQIVSVVRESDYEALERERDRWHRCAIDERDLASGAAYKEIKDHILDELDKQAGAGAALAVAVTMCAASEARTRAAEQQLKEALKPSYWASYWARSLIERDSFQGPLVLERMVKFYEENDGGAFDFGELFIVKDARAALAGGDGDAD